MRKREIKKARQQNIDKERQREQKNRKEGEGVRQYNQVCVREREFRKERAHER